MEIRQIHSITEFEHILREADDKIVMVEFTASWCPLTSVFRPFIATMSAEFDKYVLAQVNIEEAQVRAS